VPILAGGKSGAHYWIAREYVAGENVAALIDRQNAEGERDWKVACRVAVHLGKVLDYLEQHKVRHARLTLPNILIESASEMTRLADVMPEKVLDAPRPGEDARERQLAEAPFRAPEETLDAGSVDHRASLYTVGAVAYALLTGKPPYAGVSVVAIATQARDGKVVRPTKLAPDTPAPFEAAVLKLLAGRPDERYQIAADLLEVVEPIASMHEIRV
jgi:serine/threonine protein kinase